MLSGPISETFRPITITQLAPPRPSAPAVRYLPTHSAISLDGISRDFPSPPLFILLRPCCRILNN